ncbi:hypothetical protein AJ80_07654 [Polytolypa hystricis UAMH7299]|uniref:Major facilitator superfamily (MFS) profile domain-containing protein n=1 Tax=Polytolypa hystricis (strain UAMH7299) TaxID=1447883 RepID=A0A2B7XLN8_POLH7|nr:hypothetical protein AJ80_07654 [Polytolypa hystricis UAMH7299]
MGIMGIFSKKALDTPDVQDATAVDMEKTAAASDSAVVSVPEDSARSDTDNGSIHYQAGVRRVRAVTSVWSSKSLWLMFALLYLVSFVDMLLSTVSDGLTPFVTSLFEKHGLIATVGIVATIMGGCCALTLAKVVDVFGRIEGFLFMLAILILGVILKAACENVETYVAGHTLYWTGHVGLMYVIDVMLADMTSLRNRMIMFGINGTPTIASVFAGPKIADLFFTNSTFRWAFGAFTIIIAGVSIPVIALMLWHQRMADQMGLLPKDEHGRTWYQSIWHYLIEFDAVAVILITATFALILLPFNLVAYAPNGWKTGYIIAMEVVGVVCLGLFYGWEKNIAPVKFLPWKYLKEPTIIGSCLLYAVMFCSCFCWNAYFSSYLIVVYRLSITKAGHILNSFTLSSAIISPFIGVVIRYTGNIKYTAYAGIPLMLIGTALLIPFRTPDTHWGLITMTQVFVGVGTALFAACGQLAVMATVSHQEVAVVIAVWGMFGSIGASIGFAIAGALWTNIFPAQLYARLPEESKDMAAAIFADITLQSSFLDGTPEREAIVGAYADVQRKMVIAGACLMPLVLASIFIWRNVKVNKPEEQEKQTKGNLF